MPGTASVLRANEGLMTAFALLAGGPLAICLVWMAVHAQGASLMPVVFLLGVVVPVITTLFVAQLVRARRPVMAEEPGPGLEVHRGKFLDRERVFGKDVPAFLIRDAKPTMPGILDEAQVAESGVTMNVETVLVAQFSGAKEARRAVTAKSSGWPSTTLVGPDPSPSAHAAGLNATAVRNSVSARWSCFFSIQGGGPMRR